MRTYLAVDILVAFGNCSPSADLAEREFISQTTFMTVKNYLTTPMSIFLHQRALGEGGMVKHSILYPQASLQQRLRSEHFRHWTEIDECNQVLFI